MEQVRKYTPHPIIFEGQCILLLGVGGAVISLENKDCVNFNPYILFVIRTILNKITTSY